MANNGDSGLASWVDERLAVLAATPVTGLQTDSARQQEAWVRLRAAQRMMRVRRQAGMALAGAGVVGVVALWQSSDGVMADLKPERDRAAAADFALSDRAGRTVQLSQFRGRVVLVDFWATWCPPCRTEIPWFAEFQRRYANPGLTVLGVAMDEDGWKTAGPFVDSVGAEYPMVLGTGEVARRFGVETLPTTLLIDRSGRIAATHTGLVSRSAVESEIRYLLGRRG